MAGFKVSMLLREEEENTLAFFLLHRSVESRDGGVGGARVDCRQHLANDCIRFPGGLTTRLCHTP